MDGGDGHTASEFASDTGTRHYVNPLSTEPPRNPLAFKVERAPRDQISYKDIVSMMKEQVERIRELEHNIEEMRGADKRDREKDCHRIRNRDEQYQYRGQRYDDGRSSRGHDRSQEYVYTREPRSEYSHHVQHADSHPSRDQPRHYPSHEEVEDDEMPFSEYIMSVKFPRGFKPPTDMEPYDGSSDP